MKKVTLQVAPKPKSFADVKFTEADWKAAKAAGELVCNAVTAVANVRLSNGLYQFKPEAAEVELRTAVDPDNMTTSELVQTMTAFGKPPRKKMNRAAAVKFVKELLAKAEDMIDDDEGDDD